MVFETEWHSSLTTPIPAGVEPQSVIDILHDHSFLITCSPIVTRHRLEKRSEETGWIKYEVFEVVDIIPRIWKREISFHCCFQDQPDGVVSFLEAPMGIVSEAKYTVKQAEASEGNGESWVVEEHINSSCNLLLKSFVHSSMIPVRKKLHLQAIEGARKKQADSVQEERTPAAS